MKKKTVFIWMGTVVGLTIILFTVIYFFNLDNEAKNLANSAIGGPPTFSVIIRGDMDNPLAKPMDVAKIDSNIYVSDTKNKQVQVFDQSGNHIFNFGNDGVGKGQFKFPYGITGDKQGNVYVADMYNGNISIFTPKGKFIKYFEEKNTKEKLITAPGGLRIFNEKMYVTNIKSGMVYVFDLKGNKLLEIGSGVSKEDKLNAPNAVTIDLDNNIYVSDSGNQRIIKYDKHGKYLKIVNGSDNGKGNSIFVNPRGIAVDSKGTLFIVDSMAHFVYGFDKDGKKVYQFGGMGDGNDQFYLPNGLCMDEKERLYITDTFNQRVVVYN